MKIEKWKLSDIKPYDKNPRQNDTAVDVVAASIREFGFRQPIVVDQDGMIVVGHTRYRAALKLGLETVPVHAAERRAILVSLGARSSAAAPTGELGR
jgi:ParB-like chromosome segregation protein Spo0J